MFFRSCRLENKIWCIHIQVRILQRLLNLLLDLNFFIFRLVAHLDIDLLMLQSLSPIFLHLFCPFALKSLGVYVVLEFLEELRFRGLVTFAHLLNNINRPIYQNLLVE